MAKLTVSLPDSRHLAALQEEFSGQNIDFLVWDMRSAPPAEKIDLVVPPYLDSAKTLARLEGVETQLVQWQSIGYDGVSDYLPSGVRFANAASVHETATAELALGLIIAAQRDFKRFFQQQAEGIWRGGTTRALADRRVTIIGAGGVGRAIAERLVPFEVQITMLANSARDLELTGGLTVSVREIADLHAMLAETDILVLAVPLTPDTAGLIGAVELAQLPDDALLVNVARGRVVDTAALVAEVASGRLRTANDVVDPEPLPEEHSLWQQDGAIQTPHTGGDSDAMHPRMFALLVRQIRHLMRGSTPENLVKP
ncbi:2-hydroxyacid dehydrogenase [Canibacter zhoujuaniae]|uniref:2-hydroxyacid dehydrogenase n=1 Tax=Canibacter zhoujuaniae TaxID=2708343 RepID=UPI0014204A8F|nr:2-hydroxyacid dehydrogenase [Canibacter zhoujuaniae]